MATASSILNIIQEIEQISNTILAEVSAVDPALDLPVATIEAIEQLATKALQAWTASSSTPITVESVQALLPNPAPLTPPTA